MEMLIKSTTDAMKEMMSLIKSKSKAPNNATYNEKKKKRKEKHKKCNNAPICKHCGKKTPIQTRKRMLGTRSQPSIPSRQLEIKQKHLKVRGAHASRNMDAGED
jgi:hypothetical protein